MGIFFGKQKNNPVQKSWQRKGARKYPADFDRREKKQKRRFSRFLFWLLLAGFFGICAYLAFFSPFLEIDSVAVEGNQDISAAEIADKTKKSLEGKYFGLAPKNNFFLVSKKNIFGAVRSNFDRLEVSSIEKKFPGSILVKVVERKAELVWCSGGVCYFVSSDGLAYGGASGTEEDFRAKNFLVVVDDSAIPVEIGKTKMDSEYMAFIEAVEGMLRSDLGLGMAESYHTPGAASREISVRTGEGWVLKTSMETSVEETKKIIQTLFENELNEEARKNLDYLDLRVKGKIYYKMKS